ncbi:hypothetical protein [Thermocrinis sp.]
MTLLVAFLIFPRGKLEELLPISADINLDLSLAYYQALLRVEPSDQIYEAVVQSYLRLGETQKVLELVEEFHRKNPDNPETLWLKYQLLKGQYFSQEDEKQKERIKAEMEALLFRYISLRPDVQNLVKVFGEAESMYMPKLAHGTSTILARRTEDVYWAKKAYYYSIAFKDYRNSLDFIDILLEREGEVWLEEAITVSLLVGDVQKAFEYAKIRYDKLDVRERTRLIKKLIDHQLTERNYLEFRETMLKTFPLSSDQRLYLEREVMKRALWAREYDVLKKLILENLYLSKSLEYRIMLIELALATGDPGFAKEVAKKLHFGDR